MPPPIEVRLADAGLARHAARVAAHARPAIRLSPSPGAADGGSRLGGDPDLPDAAEWPEWKGKPLAFLGQVALADVAGLAGAEALPADGLLSFFYDAEQGTWGFDPQDRGSWRVLYSPAGVPLRPRPTPAAVPSDARYRPTGLTPSPILSLPAWDEPPIARLEMTDDEGDRYMDLLAGDDDASGGRHQLLGWPEPIQSGEMDAECQMVAGGLNLGGPEGYRDPRAEPLKAGASQWRLLLQLDSDEDAGMMWGDSGRLYFWIREADLAARNFDDVWMILQCY